MKKSGILLIILSLLMLICLSAGCAKEAVPADTDSTALTVTDMTGRTVELAGPAQKIVVLTAADCEIVYALGAGDAVIGRGEYCNYPEEVADIASVESGGNTNTEQIIALQPDLVLMSSMAQTEDQVNALENAGIKVVITNAADIAGVYEAITLIGSVVDKNDQAQQIVADMQAAFADIEEKTSDIAVDKTVYFEVSPLEWGLWTGGSNTFMDEIAQMLGLTNTFADIDGWAEISQEQVLERNPDYIVTVTMYYGDGPTPSAEIIGRDGWQNISAVVNGNVFEADNDAITRPGPRLVDAANSFYDFVYGN